MRREYLPIVLLSLFTMLLTLSVLAHPVMAERSMAKRGVSEHHTAPLNSGPTAPLPANPTPAAGTKDIKNAMPIATLMAAPNTLPSEDTKSRAVSPNAVTISAIGDCTLGTDPAFGYSGSFPEVYDSYGAKYFFANVQDILTEDDLTIANLETTFTTATANADKGPGVAYFFKGPPSYAQILNEGSIEAVNLANNHSWDYLEKGFADTLTALNNVGVGYFGHGQKYISNQKGVKIGMLGYNALNLQEYSGNLAGFKDAIAKDINELKQTCQLVIVSFHWGMERSLHPDSRQTDLGYFAIDQGAGLVLGHHPHVIQPVEQYKGKFIVYSLGNFSFGGNTNPEDKDTFIFQQTFEFRDGILWSAQPPDIIPCSVSSVAWRNDYRPTPVSGTQAERISQRVDFPH